MLFCVRNFDAAILNFDSLTNLNRGFAGLISLS